jgi:methionyl-tRNA synthetase
MNYTFIQQNMWIFIVLAVWEIVWKGMALWKAARNSQTGWFVALFILNTAGILPIVYLVFFDKEGRV